MTHRPLLILATLLGTFAFSDTAEAGVAGRLYSFGILPPEVFSVGFCEDGTARLQNAEGITRAEYFEIGFPGLSLVVASNAQGTFPAIHFFDFLLVGFFAPSDSAPVAFPLFHVGPFECPE